MGWRCYTAVLALVLALGAWVWPPSVAAGPYLTARAALVMDAGTGEVLWERNSAQPLPPASTTKVMTAILAIESGRLEETFRVSRFAASTPPSRIDLHIGQRMRLRHLLYALLLKSANDAAVVIAEGLAGSQAAFGRQMTARARQLGAATASFKNPHGLTARGHVASARDLAVIFRQALGYPLMRKVLKTRAIRVPIEAQRRRWVWVRTHNRLLSGHTYQVIGKTGYTRAAGRTFVGSAEHKGRETIIVLLGSSDLWGDAKRLFAHGFGLPAPTVTMAGRSGSSRYAVQIGPYKSRASASSTRAKLKQRGYTATLDGRAVRLGRFRSERSAQQFANRLKRNHGYRGTVVSMGGRATGGTAVASRPRATSGRADTGPPYAVRLGPYRSRASASATRTALKRRGYTATLDGSSVRLGRFQSRGRAQQFADRLRSNHGYRGTVVGLGKPTTTVASRRRPRAEGDTGEESIFAVKLGPYESQATAVATRTKLKRLGYTATLSGRAVRLGRFRSRRRAEQFAGRLRRNDGLKGIVVSLN